MLPITAIKLRLQIECEIIFSQKYLIENWHNHFSSKYQANI